MRQSWTAKPQEPSPGVLVPCSSPASALTFQKSCVVPCITSRLPFLSLHERGQRLSKWSGASSALNTHVHCSLLRFASAPASALGTTAAPPPFFGGKRGVMTHVRSAPRLTHAITPLSRVSECCLEQNHHQPASRLPRSRRPYSPTHPIYTLPSAYRFSNAWLNSTPSTSCTRSRIASTSGGKGECTVMSAPE